MGVIRIASKAQDGDRCTVHNQSSALGLLGARPFMRKGSAARDLLPVGGGDEEAAEAAKSVPKSVDDVVRARRFFRVMELFKVYADPVCNSKFLVLVFGQMLCSVATLMHDSYLPVYAQDRLGLSNTEIGTVQAMAQLLCNLTKGASGAAGDLLGSQARVLLFGTFMTFLSKPMFMNLGLVKRAAGPTAAMYWLFLAKLLDRMSKGVREAPTKAVINELARESGDSPDAAYGLKQSLATAGMLAGSTIASLAFSMSGKRYTPLFALSTIPPALSLIWMMRSYGDEVFGGKKKQGAAAAAGTPGAAPEALSKPAAKAAAAPQQHMSFAEKAKALFGAFKPVYWQALAVVSTLYLARSDISFVTLRARSVMSRTSLPMLTLVNTAIQIVLTAPLAKFSGTNIRNRNMLLHGGFGMMVAASACFGMDAFANPAGMLAGSAFLGLHMAMTHSVTIAMLASYMPTGDVPGIGKISGTAVSCTDLMLGFVLAGANTVAGVLADMSHKKGKGNVGCFAGSAGACTLASLLLLVLQRYGSLGRGDLLPQKVKKIA